MRASFPSPGLVEVDMGLPRFEPGDVPLARVEAGIEWLKWDPEGINHLIEIKEDLQDEIKGRERVLFGAVNLGNPHAVIILDQGEEVESFPVHVFGPVLQGLPIFPEGVNVGFLQILSRKEARLRVFERGSGETLACGSGASAAFSIARRRGLLDDKSVLHLHGGDLEFSWDPSIPGAHLLMTGPAVTVFEGSLSLSDHILA